MCWDLNAFVIISFSPLAPQLQRVGKAAHAAHPPELRNDVDLSVELLQLQIMVDCHLDPFKKHPPSGGFTIPNRISSHIHTRPGGDMLSGVRFR